MFHVIDAARVPLKKLLGEAWKRAHDFIDNFANINLPALGVARQTVPEKNEDNAGSPWEFVGLLPLFDPQRHDSMETVHKALDLSVNVKMITGQCKDEANASIPVDELIEKADGFAVVFLDNIRSSWNKIFLHMEEVRRLRIQQKNQKH